MDYRHNLRFKIFGINEPLNAKQKLLLKDNNNIKNILKKVVNSINYIKFLDRVEPSIASLDEKKQLRMNQYNNNYILNFNQNSYWAV